MTTPSQPSLPQPQQQHNLLYAELLANIRQISAIAALKTASNSSTRLELSSDRQQLALHHNGDTTIIKLPGDVASNYVPVPPVPGRRELQWRIPVLPSTSPGELSAGIGADAAPWDATSFREEYGFACRCCTSPVIQPGTIKVWQDLPSENWAEMMDFWHCHRPDVPKTNCTGESVEHVAAQKGYGAGTKFVAVKGVGKVDVMHFLVFADDCQGVKVSELPARHGTSMATQQPPLLCTNCEAQLGIYDIQAAGYRFYKWTLSLTTTSTTTSSSSTSPSPLPSTPPPIAPPLSHFLIPYLQSLTSALAVSKFVIRTPVPPTNADEATDIYLWLFAPSLRIASSLPLPPPSPSPSPSPSSPSQPPPSPSPSPNPAPSSTPAPPQPTTAAKIFFQLVTRAQGDKLVDSPDASVEEVRLPAAAVQEIKGLLESSGDILPVSARQFREWRVGILERCGAPGDRVGL